MSSEGVTVSTKKDKLKFESKYYGIKIEVSKEELLKKYPASTKPYFEESMPNSTTKLYTANYYMDMKCKEFGLKFSGFEPASTSMSYHAIITDPSNKYVPIAISTVNLMQDTYKLEPLLEVLFNNAVKSLKSIKPKVGTAAPIYWNLQTPTTVIHPKDLTITPGSYKITSVGPAKPAASPQPTKPLTFNDLYAKELGLAPKDTPIKGWSETKSMADMDMDEALQKVISSTESMEWLIPEKYLTSSKPPLHEVPSLKSVIVDLMKEDISNASKATDELAQTAKPAKQSGSIKDVLADIPKKDLDNASKSLTNLPDEMNHITMNYVKEKK